MTLRVVLFQVEDQKTKLFRLSETARLHFEKKEPFIIFVEEEKALHFVDELLWKLPSHSFLPHTASEKKSTDWVVITKTKENLNGAKYAFNLCSTPLLLDGGFKKIYDFEDLTSPSKKNSSHLRYAAYKKAGFLIEAG